MTKPFVATLMRWAVPIALVAAAAVCEASLDLRGSQRRSPVSATAALPPQRLTPLLATSALPVATATAASPHTLALTDLEAGEYFVIDSFQGRVDEGGFPAMSLEVISHKGEPLGFLKDGPGPDARLSPKGTMLAYTARTGDPTSELLLFRTTNLRSQDSWTLPAGHSITGFSWSPDERRMVVAIDGKIALITPGQAEMLPLIDCASLGDSGECDRPEWSPDGKWVAYYLTVARQTLTRV